MAKVQVTSQLADLIKTIRVQNGILSKDLAVKIDKSPAYISKLERGDIHNLDKDILLEILHFITQGNTSFDDIIEEVFATLKFMYSQEEIERQLWLDNFDTVERLIPIPGDLIDNFLAEIDMLGISYSYLLSRINANESLDDNIKSNKNYPENEWFKVKFDAKERYIKIVMSYEQLEGILEKTVNKSSYIYILAIAFYLMKIKYYGDIQNIDDSITQDLMTQATDILNKYKFYSLSEKNRLIHNAVTPEDFDNILSSFERENYDVINEILSGYKFWSERDIKIANTQFGAYLENMKWDIGFMMKLISLEFNSLSNISYTNKKSLIEEISRLITKYHELSDDANNVEVY